MSGPTSGIVIVSGMSGAGRSTVLHLLEDLGFDAVDNLPLALLRPLLGAAGEQRGPLAIGIDSRSRGFDPAALAMWVAELRGRGVQDATLVFMECDDEVLRRRYTETRRRHPMAQDRPVLDGIARERALVTPLKAAADHIVDTTATSVADLRRLIPALLGINDAAGLTITLVSFGFRNGLPREADLVLDVRFMANPHYDPALRPLTGQNLLVRARVEADPEYASTLNRFLALLLPLLPRYAQEGKSYLTIAIGCTGGQHRSVVTTEALDARLREQGWQTTVIHRDMPQVGAAPPVAPAPRSPLLTTQRIAKPRQ